MENRFKWFFLGLLLISFVSVLPGCSTPLTTREKAAGIGALGGAAAGGIIGSAVGHPGAGAAIGGALGSAGGIALARRIGADGRSTDAAQRRIVRARTVEQETGRETD